MNDTVIQIPKFTADNIAKFPKFTQEAVEVAHRKAWEFMYEHNTAHALHMASIGPNIFHLQGKYTNDEAETWIGGRIGMYDANTEFVTSLEFGPAVDPASMVDGDLPEGVSGPEAFQILEAWLEHIDSNSRPAGTHMSTFFIEHVLENAKNVQWFVARQGMPEECFVIVFHSEETNDFFFMQVDRRPYGIETENHIPPDASPTIN